MTSANDNASPMQPEDLDYVESLVFAPSALPILSIDRETMRKLIRYVRALEAVTKEAIEAEPGSFY